jgi:hypothetical protein
MPNTENNVPSPKTVEAVEERQSLDTLADDIHRHIVSTLGNEVYGQISFVISTDWPTASATA